MWGWPLSDLRITTYAIKHHRVRKTPTGIPVRRLPHLRGGIAVGFSAIATGPPDDGGATLGMDRELELEREVNLTAGRARET